MMGPVSVTRSLCENENEMPPRVHAHICQRLIIRYLSDQRLFHTRTHSTRSYVIHARTHRAQGHIQCVYISKIIVTKTVVRPRRITFLRPSVWTWRRRVAENGAYKRNNNNNARYSLAPAEIFTQCNARCTALPCIATAAAAGRAPPTMHFSDISVFLVFSSFLVIAPRSVIIIIIHYISFPSPRSQPLRVTPLPVHSLDRRSLTFYYPYTLCCYCWVFRGENKKK